MTLIKTDASPFVDDKYGLIKNIYDLPTYSGLPRIAVKMAFGGDYSTAGFNASGAGITAQHAKKILRLESILKDFRVFIKVM